MHSCLRSVTRWPQTLTQTSLHNAGQASLDRQSHVSGSIQPFGSRRPLSMAPSPRHLGPRCFCTNICDCIRIKWCLQCFTQGLIIARLWPLLCFSSCARGCRSQCWLNSEGAEQPQSELPAKTPKHHGLSQGQMHPLEPL